jgi:hypothetical protein
MTKFFKNTIVLRHAEERVGGAEASLEARTPPPQRGFARSTPPR